MKFKQPTINEWSRNNEICVAEVLTCLVSIGARKKRVLSLYESKEKEAFKYSLTRDYHQGAVIQLFLQSAKLANNNRLTSKNVFDSQPPTSTQSGLFDIRKQMDTILYFVTYCYLNRIHWISSFEISLKINKFFLSIFYKVVPFRQTKFF